MREFQRAATTCSPLPARPRRAARAARRLSAVARARASAADRDPRLARGADAERVRPLPRLLPGARASSACIADPREVRVPRRQAARAGDCHVDLIYKRVLIDELVEQWRARQPDGARRARPRRVHGEPVPLQAAAQEGEPRGAQRRAQRAPVHADEQRGDRAARPVDARGRGAEDAVRRQRRSTCVPFMRATTASGSCSSRTTTTAARASCSAGRSTTRRGTAAIAHGARRAVHRAGAGRDCRASRIPSLVDGTLQVVDRMLDTAPFVSLRRVHGRLPDADLDRRRC